MAPMLADSPLAGHHMTSETAPSGPLKKIEIPEMRRIVGQIVALARQRCGWSQKELIARIEDATGKLFDTGQIAKWESGVERPQFEFLFIVEPMRHQLVIAMASGLPDFEVVTELRLRRPA
jgi:ribosome-binding protein aMBF1 (putative translation factor)